MWKFFHRLFPTDQDLEKARAENQAARQEVVRKVKKAKSEGVTVSLSREALNKLKAREDGVY